MGRGRGAWRVYGCVWVFAYLPHFLVWMGGWDGGIVLYMPEVLHFVN